MRWNKNRETIFPTGFTLAFLIRAALLLLGMTILVVILGTIEDSIIALNGVVRSAFVSICSRFKPDINEVLEKHGASVQWITMTMAAFSIGFALISLSTQRMQANNPYRLSEYIPLSGLCYCLAFLTTVSVFVNVLSLHTLSCVVVLLLSVYSISLSVTIYRFHSRNRIAWICSRKLQKKINHCVKNGGLTESTPIAEECARWYRTYMTSSEMQISLQECAEQQKEVFFMIMKSKWFERLNSVWKRVALFQIGYDIVNPSLSVEGERHRLFVSSMLKVLKDSDTTREFPNLIVPLCQGILLADLTDKLQNMKLPGKDSGKTKAVKDQLNEVLLSDKTLCGGGLINHIMAEGDLFWIGLYRTIRYFLPANISETVFENLFEKWHHNSTVKIDLPTYIDKYEEKKSTLDCEIKESSVEFAIRWMDQIASYRANEKIAIGIGKEEYCENSVKECVTFLCKHIIDKAEQTSEKSMQDGEEESIEIPDFSNYEDEK